MALLWDHHCIGEERAISGHAVIEISGYDIQAAENRIYLIASNELAAEVGQTVHNGGHLGSYTNGVINYLNDLNYGDSLLNTLNYYS